MHPLLAQPVLPVASSVTWLMCVSLKEPKCSVADAVEAFTCPLGRAACWINSKGSRKESTHTPPVTTRHPSTLPLLRLNTVSTKSWIAAFTSQQKKNAVTFLAKDAIDGEIVLEARLPGHPVVLPALGRGVMVGRRGGGGNKDAIFTTDKQLKSKGSGNWRSRKGQFGVIVQLFIGHPKTAWAPDLPSRL